MTKFGFFHSPWSSRCWIAVPPHDQEAGQAVSRIVIADMLAGYPTKIPSGAEDLCSLDRWGTLSTGTLVEVSPHVIYAEAKGEFVVTSGLDERDSQFKFPMKLPSCERR